jgi:hypothetical protein
MPAPAADVVPDLALHYDAPPLAAALVERLRAEGYTEMADVLVLMTREAGAVASPRGKAQAARDLVPLLLAPLGSPVQELS